MDEKGPAGSQTVYLFHHPLDSVPEAKFSQISEADTVSPAVLEMRAELSNFPGWLNFVCKARTTSQP